MTKQAEVLTPEVKPDLPEITRAIEILGKTSLTNARIR
jgi:hypothetical protein